jgi:modulator of FtsH protease HflC
MKKSGPIVIIFAVILIIIIAASSIIIVNEGEYVYVRRFSKIVKIIDEPGLYFKTPFIEDKNVLPKMKKLYDLKPSDVLTLDKKAMLVDNYVVWQIIKPLEFVKTVSFVTEAEKRIDAAVYNAVKNTMGMLEQNSIINEELSNRGNLDELVTSEASKQLLPYGIKIWDVKIKRLDLPESNEQAVFSRMISERQRISTQYIAEGNLESEKIKNEVNKKVTILISESSAKAEETLGEGEAEYMRILSEAFSGDKLEFYEFTRTLEAYKNSLKGEKTLIIPSDSQFAKYLTGNLD